ncbi:response regulator transcription factor [Herbiconiux liangxiaofengii]|uniref:response regulator transcription factor n=1 Tax=Herbiconiux liangxiaofengii TaxID=3342795 RepID=UPI0035B7DCFF
MHDQTTQQTTNQPTDAGAGAPAPVRVAIVDDHESVRLGIRAACQEAGFEVVAASASVSELWVALAGQECDVVVLDLSLGDGFSVTENVQHARSMGASVLVHSIADRVGLVREALAAGAAGVVPKSAATKTVIASVAAVARGDVLNNLEWASAIDADPEFGKAQLAQRERDVLHLYASGLPLSQVALKLNIKVSTAKEYLDRVRAKYVEVGRPARSKVELLRRAVEDGILALDDDGHVG